MQGLERQAVRLMVFRMAVALAFFLAALAIQTTVGAEIAIQPFFYLIAFVLTADLLYSLIYGAFPSVRPRRGFIFLQLCGDASAVTLFSFLTGGYNSVFTFLYHILIVVAGFLLQRRGAFTMAATAGLLYGTLCVVQLYGWLSPTQFVSIAYDPPTPGAALYGLTAHLAGFLLVAMLMSAMLSRQEHSDATLGRVRKDLSYFRDLNDQIVSSFSGGLVTSDREGTVSFANPSARALLDETLPEGWNLFRRIEALSGAALPPPEEIPLAGKELHLTLPRDRYLRILLSPLKEGSSHQGYLALLWDETELTRLRNSLLLKERLTAAGEMAANIAHEIKNPLGSISGAAQMLGQKAVPGSREAELLGIIQGESGRLGHTLDDFLKYVKPPPLRKHVIDLVELLQGVGTLFQSDPALASGEVRFHIDLPTSPLLVELDSDLARQAVWNLLQNARKAIKTGVGEVRLSLRRKEGWAILEVMDTGVGIPKSEIHKCFEPFHRGFSSGAGLGLSVVFRIMERHGGRVELDSVFGSGTSCRLFFPLEKNRE